MTKQDFQVGDYVEVVQPINAMGRYEVGSRGFISGKWQRLSIAWGNTHHLTPVWSYAVEFDHGRSATLYADEMKLVEDIVHVVEDVPDAYMIIGPLFTFYITPCGEDAPDTWFDHSSGKFLNSSQLQQVLSGYRSAGVPVL